nr:MAG TPA: hypothetical protein [Bacteriophage sp.]
MQYLCNIYQHIPLTKTKTILLYLNLILIDYHLELKLYFQSYN